MYKWYQSLASISSPGCFLLRSLRLCGDSQATGQQPETGCPSRCQAPGAAPGRMLANRVPKSVPGTRCGARPDASKKGAYPNRCQAPSAAPGRMLANRLPKSVPGTRCGARSDASKRGPKSVPGTRCDARSDASKQEPKSVPGTRCGARSDASKQGAQIGARHPVRRQAGC